MAREMYLAGVPEEELQPTPPPEPPKTFKEKMKHFWFYYKWPTIIVVAVALVVTFLTVQAVNKPRYDYTVVLMTDTVVDLGAFDPGDNYVDVEEALAQELAKYGRDLNDDGEVKVLVENLSLNGAGTMTIANNQKLMGHLAAGDVMFFVFEKSSYEDFLTRLGDDNSQFFSTLDLDIPNVDNAAGYYNWKDDPRRLEGGLQYLPEEMYFGTRGTTGTGGKDPEMAQECRDLLIAFITDTPLTPAEESPAS